MDVTEELIRMFEKAEEIQKQKPCHLSIRIYSVNLPEYDSKGNLWFNKDNKDLVWLPSQRQLQEIAWAKEYHEDNIDHLIMRFYIEIHNTPDFNWGYWDIFRTMEAKWLGFVMRTRYNKIWDGKEWIKEEIKKRTK